jgi:flavorubredoxin
LVLKMRNDLFRAVKLSEHVWWVGAIDWGIRDFHGYLTNRGSTYNAYLVCADKLTLIDTVKAPFKDEMLSRIASVVNPADISIIISNHSEMDHSGCLPEVIEAVNPDKVYASLMGVKALTHHFPMITDVIPVKDGETINLGNMDIVCCETRMIHWPDSMVSYLPQEHILFSQDMFGMHIASYERFTDEIDQWVLEYETKKYFANILLPYAALISTTIDKLNQRDVEPLVIAPDHGPVWRSKDSIENVKQWYLTWAEQKPSKKAVVIYDTMWGSTEVMARALGEGLAQGGAEVKLMSLKKAHRSDIATELLGAGAIVAGSPTINNSLFPTIADTMSYLKGLRPKHLIGAVFGSYGWSGESVKELEAILTSMKVDIIGERVNVMYVPNDEDLIRCRDLGLEIAQKMNPTG